MSEAFICEIILCMNDCNPKFKKKSAKKSTKLLFDRNGGFVVAGMSLFAEFISNNYFGIFSKPLSAQTLTVTQSLPVSDYKSALLTIIITLTLVFLLLCITVYRYRRDNYVLRIKNQQFMEFFQQTPIKLHITDKLGNFLFINKQGEKFINGDSNAAIGKTAYDLFTPDIAATATALDQIVIETESAAEQEDIFWTKKGLVTYQTCNFPLYDKNGKFNAIGSSGFEITKLEQNDKNSFQSKDVLIRLINQIPALIILKDKLGRYMLVNETVCKWNNASYSELIGRTSVEIFSEQSGRDVTKEDQKVLITETSLEKEFEFGFADGQHRTILSTRFPLYDKENVLIGSGFIGTDITHLRKAERTAQQIIRAIERVSDPVAFYNSADELVFANTIFRTPVKAIRQKIRIGTTLESNLRVYLEHGFIKEAEHDQEQFIQEQLTLHKTSSAPFEIIFKTGASYRFRLKRLKDGGTLVFGIDISTLKEIQKSLEQSEKRFRDFTQAANDWFWETNENHQFTVLSPRFEKFLIEERSPEDTTLKPILHLLERKKAFRDYISSPLNDDSRYWRTSGVPVFDEQSFFCGFRGTTNDVTEEIQARIELENHKSFLELEIANRTEEVNQKALALEVSLEKEKEYSQLQKQFISMISHEYRTPLTIIDGVSQRLIRMKNKLTADDIEKRATTVRRTVQKMIDMIDITLATSSIEEGKVVIVLGNLDIKALLFEISDNHRELSPDYTFSMDLNSIKTPICADRRLIEQVFNNLFSNAIKYSPNKREISIRGQQYDERIEVSVIDHGIGIPENEIDKIFTRFFRANTAKGMSGTGLGLSLCKTFVDLHHGKIYLTSEEGKGSTFTVSLPIEQPETLSK